MNSSPATTRSDDSDGLPPAGSQILAILLSLFVLAGVNTTLLEEVPCLALFGMLGLMLVFLSHPMRRGKTRFKGEMALTLLLCGLTVLSFGYIFVQHESLLQRFWVDGAKLGERAGFESPWDASIGLIGILLVLEGTRRAIGWTLPILCGLFILYTFSGPSLPDWLFPHRGYSWERLVSSTFLQNMGVFGIALKVMFLYVFLFVLFGTLLEQTGATGYIIEFARHIFRNSDGAPAKVAVLSSGLMGSLSGSAVANTATTGTFTIPLMKSSGFKPETAAGVEAAASSGGALMPPIMGAGAYMMLEMVEPQVTYLQIIQAALIPAILYYVALLLTVHFQAKKVGANPVREAVSKGATLHPVQGFVFFGAFALLITFLLIGFTPFRSVSYSLLGILVLSLVSPHTRVGLHGIRTALVRAGMSGTTLIVAAACVGIILGVVNLTGIGTKLPNAIQPLAHNNSILALVLLMVSTIILGMGLPSAVCYLLMATLIGGVLEILQTAPLAAHLFIFYFGMMSMVTPPVALAAYTAAAIARADVMKSSLAAFRFSLIGFALPYAFVLQPELLMLQPDGSPAGILPIVINVGLCLIAIAGLAASMASYAWAPIRGVGKWVLLVASLTMFFTRSHGPQVIFQVVGAVLILILLAINWSRRTDAGMTSAPI